VLLLAAVVLTAAAWLRSAEYDEQYTLFLTAGVPRPAWPATVFPAGDVALVQSGATSLGGIARDLRATDVHPPLYFWAAWLWRCAFGPGLLAVRMLSVLCGVASVALVGVIAGRSGIRPAVAMLLTLGCYGFVYASVVARGFAAAEVLTLGGVALLGMRRPVLAGICLGAACGCNYLAVFVGVAVVVAEAAWLAVPAAVPFLALDAWFFAAQHGARLDQFPPFALLPSLVRLAEYQGAAIFGGLPLYVDGGWQIVVETGLGAFAVGLLVLVMRRRPWRDHRRLFVAALAPPAGLLLLGAVFNNTPIEMRYLSFGLPFAALLAAAALPRWVCALTAVVQVACVVGLLVSPRTMQPARAAATEAARMAGDAIVLVPAGNDGVGTVGSFGIEAPSGLPMLLIRPHDALPGMAPFRRVALALVAQDQDGRAAIATARRVLSPPNWRRVAIGSNLEVFERGD
jgi:hypothetical protein